MGTSRRSRQWRRFWGFFAVTAALVVGALASTGAGNAAASTAPAVGAVPQQAGQPILIGPPYSIVGDGDLDGNGTADIVWHNASTNETQIWFMNGNRVVRPATVVDESGQPIFVGVPWAIVGSGDLDGNGRSDIVWYNSSTGETQIWFMNGNQVVGRGTVVNESGQAIFIGPPFSIAAIGTGEIIWHNANTGETQIWFMNGNQVVVALTVIDGAPTPKPTPTHIPFPTPTNRPPL